MKTGCYSIFLMQCEDSEQSKPLFWLRSNTETETQIDPNSADTVTNTKATF